MVTLKLNANLVTPFEPSSHGMSSTAGGIEWGSVTGLYWMIYRGPMVDPGLFGLTTWDKKLLENPGRSILKCCQSINFKYFSVQAALKAMEGQGAGDQCETPAGMSKINCTEILLIVARLSYWAGKSGFFFFQNLGFCFLQFRALIFQIRHA